MGWLSGLLQGVGSIFLGGSGDNGTEAAAQQAANTSREWLDFSKQQYADVLPYIKQAQEKSVQVSDAQIASQQQADALAKDYADYAKTTYRPLEQQIVADSQTYDTPGRRQSAADTALADVNMAFDRQNQATARALAASGVDPGSARSQAVMGSQGIEQARQGASAAFMARKGVEDTGYARQINAVSLGRNLPASQNASAQTALAAGNSAVNSAMAGVNAGSQQVGLMNTAYGGAGNLALGAGNLQSRADEATAQMWAQLGSAAIKAYSASDENLKTDVQDEDPDKALAEVVQTPVKGWKYDPAKMAAAGLPMDSGAKHTGPMAQDVQATMGEQVAPGGKVVDLISMNGKAMLAIKALDKKVNNIAALVQQGIPEGATA